MRLDEAGELGEEPALRRGDQCARQFAEARLDGDVRLGPRRDDVAFPRGLHQVCLQPLRVDRTCRRRGLERQRHDRRIDPVDEIAVARQPVVDHPAPLWCERRERERAGSHPGRSLRVVCRLGEHRHRSDRLAAMLLLVEARDRGGERLRRATDLAERGEREPAIEGTVLDALRHRGAAELLPPIPHRWCLGDRIGDPVDPRPFARAPRNGTSVGDHGGERGAGGIVVGEVGAVPVEHERQGRQCRTDRGRVGRLVDVGAQRRDDGARQTIEVGAQPAVEHLASRREAERFERVHTRAVPPLVEQHGLGARIEQRVLDRDDVLVTGGAVDRPRGRELLGGCDDLLDEEQPIADRRTQPAQIAAGVGEAVDVVDTDTRERRVCGEVARDRVDDLGDVAVLDADCDEVVDREEPADVALRVAPVDEAVVLVSEQLVDAEFGGAVCEREAQWPVAQFGTEITVAHRQLAVCDHVRERCTELRDDHLPVGGRPVDVEPPGCRRRRPVAQHRPPGSVELGLCDRDVVRHVVDDDPDPVLERRAQQRVQAG